MFLKVDFVLVPYDDNLVELQEKLGKIYLSTTILKASVYFIIALKETPPSPT